MLGVRLRVKGRARVRVKAVTAATFAAAAARVCRRLQGLQLGERPVGELGRRRVGGVVRPRVPLILVTQLRAHLRVRPGPEA